MSGTQAMYPSWSEFKLLVASKLSLGNSSKTTSQPSPEAVPADQPNALAAPKNHDDKSWGGCATITMAPRAPDNESKDSARGTSSSGTSLWDNELQEEGEEEEGRHGRLCKKKNKKVQIMVPVGHISDTQGCSTNDVALARARNDDHHSRRQDRRSLVNHGRSCDCFDCRSGWTYGAVASGSMWESGVVDADILCMRALTEGVGVLYGP